MKQNILLTLFSIILFASCKKSNSVPQEKIIYQTNFSVNDGKWYVGTDSNFTAQLQNGYYQLSNSDSFRGDQVYISPIFNNLTGNMAIEANFLVSHISPNMPLGYPGGLVWNANTNNHSSFNFSIYTSGKFIIYGWPDGVNGITYKSPTYSEAIKTNDYNTLRIELRNNHLYFLINGTQVYDMAPINSNLLDQIGFYLDPNVTMRVNNFKALQLE